MRLLHRNRAGNARPTLGRVLQRVHLGLALIAVGTAGIFLTLVALFALRAYADHNLHLIARSTAIPSRPPWCLKTAPPRVRR